MILKFTKLVDSSWYLKINVNGNKSNKTIKFEKIYWAYGIRDKSVFFFQERIFGQLALAYALNNKKLLASSPCDGVC